MMPQVKLAQNLALPLETVTQTIGILAKRRAGKSYLARRMAEQLFQAGQQVVMIDPKGDQWGIRSAADGHSPGMPIVILGGEHGDIPRLEVSSGEVVAKLVVEERVSALIDLSFFRKHEVATFMTAFMENLYRLKARESFRTPMMLLIDEADAIAPQKPQKGEERMLGAAEDIVRRGGQRGIGCCLVTQRSAVLNKNVLTQVQILIALRTIAPQDLAALNAWVDVHGTPEQQKTLMESLPALPTGDAWVWSPGWPDTEGIFKHIHVLPIETFDSGATPKPGEKLIEPKRLADVDLDGLRRQMAATIEKSRAEDPRELRKRIAALEKELDQEKRKAPAAEIKTVEVPAVGEEQIKHIMSICYRIAELQADMAISIEGMTEAARDITAALGKIRRPAALAGARQIIDKPVNRPASMPYQKNTGNPSGLQDAGIGSGGLRRMLIALAQRSNGLSARQLGVRAGLSSKSGTFTTYLARARSAGWIDRTKGHLTITEAGLAALGDWDPLPTGPDLLRHWLTQLGDSGAARMLQALADSYPMEMSKQQLAETAGMTGNSGTFTTYLARLRSLELIEGRSELHASDELFE